MREAFLLCACLLFLWPGTGAAERPGFDRLLQEGGLRYSAPAGFEERLPGYSPFGYEKRLVSEALPLEVRYSIRPLNRIEVDYEDPHNAAPHPNDLFDMLFRSVIEVLSDGPDSVSRAYPPETAAARFNAGWAAVAVMDIKPEVSRYYTQGLLLAMHRNDRADAYVLVLTNDLAAHKSDIDTIHRSLGFIERP